MNQALEFSVNISPLCTQIHGGDFHWYTQKLVTEADTLTNNRVDQHSRKLFPWFCDYTGIEFRFHDLRRTFATHAQANGVAYELIQKALNHKSQSVTEGYIITQIDTLRPVFDAVADGYLRYYDFEIEHERKVQRDLEEMNDDEMAELARDRKPAKFPDRGKTKIK